MEKIKIAFICHVSNNGIRSKLHQRIPWYEKLSRKLLKKNPPLLNDFAQWNTFAIEELSKIEKVELSVIAPAQFMTKEKTCFSIGNVRYFFFKDEDDYLFRKIKNALFPNSYHLYHRNRKKIQHCIKVINPDIVQIVGAENPYYSLSALDISKETPLIVQLQTLMSDPAFLKNVNNISNSSYTYRADVEKKVIMRADYIATKVELFKTIIVKDIKPDAKFLDMSLPLSENVNREETKKEYDFVYFASNISKACDLALEAFGLAHRKHPDIRLDIIGNYSDECKTFLDMIINKYDISDCVFFEGKLPSHEDVMYQIRKSRFALLPLKIDLVSGTIRESMANGLPVLTTITQGTPMLNKDYPCALLSEIGNHQSLADNMCKLLEDEGLAKTLKENGYKKAGSRVGNTEIVAQWMKEYLKILNVNI